MKITRFEYLHFKERTKILIDSPRQVNKKEICSNLFNYAYY